MSTLFCPYSVHPEKLLVEVGLLDSGHLERSNYIALSKSNGRTMESKVSTLFSTLVATLVAVNSPSLNLANVLGPVLVGRITSIYFVPKIPGRVSVRKYVASVPSGQGFGRTTKISFRLAGWTWPKRLPKCRTIYRSCGNYCCFAETGYNHPQRLRKDLDAFTALLH